MDTLEELELYFAMLDKFGEHFTKAIMESIDFQRGRADEKILEGMEKAIKVILEDCQWQRLKNADKIVKAEAAASRE